LPRAIDLIQSTDRYHRSSAPDANILVVGVPNVGKSTLINRLRNHKLKIKGKATVVGPTPGVTRSVMTKIRVSNDPLIYLIDTPGIMMPNIKNNLVGVKLAACGEKKPFICIHLPLSHVEG